GDRGRGRRTRPGRPARARLGGRRHGHGRAVPAGRVRSAGDRGISTWPEPRAGPGVETGPSSASDHAMIGGVESTIRLLLADDQALVRGALAALLDLEPDFEVVAEVGRGDEVVEAARRTRPDVALLDVEMPGLDGIAASAALRAAVPSCKVLMVTTFGRPGYLRRAMAAGASGFVVKDTPARQLADAVRRVNQGLRVVDPALAADSLAYGDSPLTDREADVLREAAEGGTVADIAAALHLSDGTVRNHLSSAIGKTGARTRAEAVRVASANGWLLGN